MPVEAVVARVVEVATQAAVRRPVDDARELSKALRLALLVSVASNDVTELYHDAKLGLQCVRL